MIDNSKSSYILDMSYDWQPRINYPEDLSVDLDEEFAREADNLEGDHEKINSIGDNILDKYGDESKYPYEFEEGSFLLRKISTNGGWMARIDDPQTGNIEYRAYSVNNTEDISKLLELFDKWHRTASLLEGQ